jgi:hypothetical protein
MTLVGAPCEGSGMRPLETVILDTVPGVEPTGTCPVCEKLMPLDFYRMPTHPEKERSHE